MSRDQQTGSDYVSGRADLGVVFYGCRVEVLNTLRLTYPAALPRPVFLIETLGPCDGLLVTSLRIGHSENQLAVIEVPAAVFEQPPRCVIDLPPLLPGNQLILEFANRSKEPASFLVWLGTHEGIAAKYERLLAAKVAARP